MAIRWHDDHLSAGKQARARIWRLIDAPSSTGKISLLDVQRWLRNLMRSCHGTGAISYQAVQCIFCASAAADATEDHHDDLPVYIEPGLAFWRLLLLVSCYVDMVDAFAPSDGSLDVRVAPEDFTALGRYLCRWVAHSTPAHIVKEEAMQRYGRRASFDQLCEWGVRQLLRGRQHGAVEFFRRLELVQTGDAELKRPKPVAVPLALL